MGNFGQEESLCRSSTLYYTIDQKRFWDKFYNPNRNAGDVRHTDAVIYSPGIVICKSEEDTPKRLPESEFVTVDVLSCSAPNLSPEPATWVNPETGRAIRMEPETLYRTHVRRARHLMHIAAANNVDILILGAFGCGAFRNTAEYVARAYYSALEKYRNYFDMVYFGIFCREIERENYTAFLEQLDDFIDE